jgi:SSS family solute:Na+ symporter
MPSFFLDHDDGVSVIDSAQALRGMRAQFQNEFETYRAITPSFARLARQLMERQHWNSSSFKDKTLLDGSAFSRIMSGAEKHWSFETVMAICVGLGVDRQTADKLLEAAGVNNMSLAASCWVMGLLAAAYVAAGGLKACAWADLIQGTALILGGVLIAYFTFDALGKADVSTLAVGVSATRDAAQGGGTEGMGVVQRFMALNGHKLHMFLPKDNNILPWTAICLGLWIPNFYYWGLNQYITQRMLGSASLSEGQKGIVFAAVLKLMVPFVIVFPGLVAFNLFSAEMEEHGRADFVKAFERDAAAEAAPLTVYQVTPSFVAAEPAKAAQMEAHNAKVVALAKAQGKGFETKEPYKTDTAFGLLVSKLCMGKAGFFGFILAAMLGAVVSSLAAVLNAASTIFSVDIYKEYINRRADARAQVSVGRICVGVFVVVGCVIAPLLDDPKFGGIFTYIQEFQGYVSPGVLAVFVYGLATRRSTGAVGVVGLLFAPALYGVLQLTSGIDFLNRMAICFGADLVLMTALGMVCRREKPVDFTSDTKIDLRPSKGAMIGGVCVILVTVVFYVVFR